MVNKKLQQTSQKGFFHNIFDKLPEGYQILDFEYRYLYLNETAVKQGKKTAEELLGYTMMEMYPGIETTPMFSILQQCMQERIPRQMENEFIFEEVKKGYYFLSFVPVPEGVLIMSTDITEQKNVEEVSRLYLQKITDQAPGAIYVFQITPDGVMSFPFISRGIEDIHPGLTAEMLRKDGSLGLSTMHPDDAERVQASIETSYKTLNRWDIEFRVIVDDGNIKWHRGNASPEKQNDGTVKWFGTFQDITERKLANDKIRESENFLSLIYNSVAEAILVISMPAGVISHVNKALTDIFDYPPDEIIGKTVRILFPTEEAYLAEMEKQLNAIQNNRSLSIDELELSRKDGLHLFCEAQTTFLRKNDSVEKVIVVLRDVSERQLLLKEIIMHRDHLEKLVAERTEELRTSLEEANDLYEGAPCGYHSLNADGIIVRINNTELEWLGYTRNEVIGKMGMKDILTPESFKKFQELSPVLVEEGKINNQEYEAVRKNGSTFYISINSNAIYNDDLKFLLSRSTLFDITARKVEEKKVELIIESSPHAIILVDSNGVIKLVNTQAINYFGYNRNELIESKIEMLVPNENKTDHRKYVSDFLSSPVDHNMGAGRHLFGLRKDGSKIPIEVGLRTMLIEGHIFTQASIIDITERKKHEDEIKEAKAAAERANLAKSEFLSNMSHEIRTPMNAVLGYTELLSSTIVDQTQRDYINSIKSSGRSLLSLINDILDLSKIEAGKLEMEYDYVDTYHLFSEFERIFSFKISEKGLKFILDIAPGTPNGIHIDETRVRQIVFNLIGNAVKFTSEGTITLKVFTENPHSINHSGQIVKDFIDLVIEVKDTGIGISKKLQEAIFEPFIQERDSNKYGGTGLGLAITRRLTGLMNGTITVKSKPGKGSTFSVKLPEIGYLKDFSKTNVDIRIDPAEIVFEEALLLIADDVEHNRSYIRDALIKTNLKIIEAGDGLEAYKMSKEIVPDLIITDIRMPRMDGFQLLNKIKTDKNLKHLPVIAYSAMVLKSQKEKIEKSEFAGLLIKPVKVSELYIELINFLPFKSTSRDGSDKPDSQVDLNSEITDLPGLIHALETGFFTTWETFAVTQPIREIREFGKDLNLLGLDHKSATIAAYGNDLVSASDSFNIGAILKLLGKYESIIKTLKG